MHSTYQDPPRHLHKNITKLIFGSRRGLRSLAEETGITTLTEKGFLCWSGVTKCENTARPTDGVDPKVNIACSEVAKSLKDYSEAYVNHWLNDVPEPEVTQAALDGATTALINSIGVVQDFDTTHVNVQVVFTRDLVLAKKLDAAKRSKEQRTSTPDRSNSDDHVADLSLNKKAKTSKTDHSFVMKTKH